MTDFDPSERELAASAARRWGKEALRYLSRGLNPGYCCKAAALVQVNIAVRHAARKAFEAFPELAPAGKLEGVDN